MSDAERLWEHAWNVDWWANTIWLAIMLTLAVVVLVDHFRSEAGYRRAAEEGRAIRRAREEE